MAKTTVATVDAYIAAQPEERRAVLRRVREIIRKALPKAEETISYQIPAYKVPGGTAIFFAGWAKHYSLYPVSEDVLAELGADASVYTFSKGTMRFRLDAPVPSGLITRIAKLKAKQIAEAQKKKAR